MANEYVYTNFKVDYALDNNDAQDDATISGTGYNSFSDISRLPEGTECPQFVTQEHNYMVLDGSITEEYDDIGFMSEEMSDGDGHFQNNPTIVAEFEGQHTSFVITFNFVEDSPTKAIITWFLGGVQIYAMTQEWSGNETICTVQHPIEAYDKITVEFIETLPYRYVKLNRLEFGTTMHWDETIVKSATMVKGCDRLSNMLSVDTLTFDLVDTTNAMNFGNPMGMHTLFKRDQAMYPMEIVQEEGKEPQTIPLGKFYLSSFTTEGNVGKIQAYSYLGVMDKIPYPGSYLFSTSATVEYILSDIFTVAGLDSTQYSIDTTTANQRLTGLIKPMSCREALREVLFACHSAIDTSDPEKIKIYKYSDSIITGLDRAHKIYTKVSSLEPVTGVKLNYTTYQVTEELSQIHNGTYDVGVYTVTFDKPYSLILVENAAMVHASAYGVTFRVVGDEVNVRISGYEVTETTKYVIIKRELKQGEVEKIEEYNTTLCTDEYARTLAQTIYAYHNSMNLSLQIQHYATDISTDYARFVENPNVELDGFISMFTQRTFNLTGGFVDSAKMIGRYDTANRYYFTGRNLDANPGSTVEIYTGESDNGGIGIL